MKRIRRAALLALLAVTGCNTPPLSGPETADFGNAVRQNIAVMAVNPPRTVAGPAPVHDGNRIARAVAAYRANQVEPPRELRTSDLGG